MTITNFTFMKTTIKNFIMLTMVAVFAVSCVQDDDYSIPMSLGNEENAGLQILMATIDDGSAALISITELKALYAGQVTLIESNLAVKGYVSSSDFTGNFYKEFYLQDQAENPTAGVGVSLNQVDSYNQFNIGREVYISLQGLYIGENASEVLTVGGSIDGSRVGELTTAQVSNHIFRSTNTETLVPVVLNMSSINDSHMGLLASFEDAQFPSGLAGQSFVSADDDYDTQHALISCLNGAEFLIETSSFASFNQMPLPVDGRGTITGVILKSYGGDDRVMVLNTDQDINFTDNRCDPVYEETFNTAVDNTDLDISGWINYAESGGQYWTEQVYGGNGYAEFTAYNTGDSLNVGWLISPGIDMDAQDGEILNFQTEYAYPDSGHYPLEVFVSTDFDGTESGVSSATWEPISAVIAHPDVTGDWFTWIDSGAIDLSTYSGTLHIAFKYTGSDTSNQNSTIHVENVIISVP